MFYGGMFSDAWEVADHAAARYDIARHAVLTAEEEEKTLIAVIETWPYFGGVRTALGLGEAAGRWKECFELAGVPKRRIVTVNVNDWRKGIFGPRKHLKVEWKSKAVQECKLRFRRALGSNAAEASLIGLYASYCDEVLGLLPKGGQG